jgi:hypothetical protein
LVNEGNVLVAVTFNKPPLLTFNVNPPEIAKPPLSNVAPPAIVRGEEAPKVFIPFTVIIPVFITVTPPVPVNGVLHSKPES